MRDSLALRFLYNTVIGRMILWLLVQPWVSKAAGRFLSSRASWWLVPYYIRKHKIDMSGIEVPPDGFSSFNTFFTRKRKTDSCDLTHNRLISPCDGFLSLVEIGKHTVFTVKNTRFSLEELLKDRKLAAKFQDGTALIFRLTPANYHRYCHVADGRVLCSRKIRGKLHCVRPVAIQTVPVFAQNSREYQVVRTEEFGMIVQMEVGALLVGKIKNHELPSGSDHVQKGREKGYFEFGGSTIIVLLQKDVAVFNENLQQRENEDGEIQVRRGEWIAGGKE